MNVALPVVASSSTPWIETVTSTVPSMASDGITTMFVPDKPPLLVVSKSSTVSSASPGSILINRVGVLRAVAAWEAGDGDRDRSSRSTAAG